MKFKLSNLLNSKSKMSIKNKLLLYKQMVLPILLYAAPVWYQTCNTNRKKLESFHNKSLRDISDMPLFVRNAQIKFDTNETNIRNKIAKISSKFYDKAITHSNVYISEIINTTVPRNNRIVHPYDFYLKYKTSD